MDPAIIEAALAPGTWGAAVALLESIDTVEDLKQVWHYVIEHYPGHVGARSLPAYHNWIEKWENVELTPPFRAKFPLVAAKLGSRTSIRMFFRGAEFAFATPELVAEVAESILYEHEVEGKQLVQRPAVPVRHFSDPLSILHVLAVYTQLQALALRTTLFPQLHNSGCSGYNSDWTASFDWRSSAQKVTDETLVIARQIAQES